MSTSPLPAEYDGPRACTPHELPLVLDLINHVFRTGAIRPGEPPARPTMGWDYSHIYHSDNLGRVRVVARLQLPGSI